MISKRLLPALKHVFPLKIQPIIIPRRSLPFYLIHTKYFSSINNQDAKPLGWKRFLYQDSLDKEEVFRECSESFLRSASLPGHPEKDPILAFLNWVAGKRQKGAGDLEGALTSFKTGQETLMKSNERANEVLLLLSYEICFIYALQQKWKDVITQADVVSATFEKLTEKEKEGRNDEMATTLKIATHAFLEINELDLCKKNGHAALQLYQKTTDSLSLRNQIGCYDLLTSCYMQEKNWAEFTDTVDKIIELASQCQIPELTESLIAQVHQLMSVGKQFGAANFGMSHQSFGVYLRLEKLLNNHFAGRTEELFLDAWNAIAMSYQMMDKPKKVLEILERIIKTQPKESFRLYLWTAAFVPELLASDRYTEVKTYIQVLKDGLDNVIKQLSSRPDQETRMNKEIIHINGYLADYYQRMGEYDESLKYQINLPALKVRTIYEVLNELKKAINYYCCGKNTQALEAAQESLKMWENIDQSYDHITYKYLKALIQDKRTNKYVQKVFEDIISLCKKDHILFESFRILHACFYEEGDYEKCIDCLEKTRGLPSIPKTQDPRVSLPILMPLMDKRAIELMSILKKNSENNNTEHRKIQLVERTIHTVHLFPQEYKMLVRYYLEKYEDLLKGNESSEARALLARVRLSIGRLLLDFQANCLAIETLQKSIETLKIDPKDHLYLGFAYYYLGVVFNRLFDKANSKSYFEKFEECSKGNKNPEETKITQFMLMAIPKN